MATLTFLGAAGTVTGSRYLLEAGGERLMIDCGLFQGPKELRLRNWADLPIPPQSIQWVVLTHAHLDHARRRPRSFPPSTAFFLKLTALSGETIVAGP